MARPHMVHPGFSSRLVSSRPFVFSSRLHVLPPLCLSRRTLLYPRHVRCTIGAVPMVRILLLP
ncbi:hypothetical protein CCHR01_07993 [Colletotrichum chrysophilum]|uniref:Uncharacterized protein n=1 Tax=Colletotrichum chrysophilum TaxID=1836956 RepID=A0AAD9AJM6_9PEZI|nr:hypothetical protein K456DRAFT_118400 [Colletotrichum gloeosporioides 23]KAK1849396.1 hypothetical protein CCHR01_07993 [Colletotrichum chrysophilum]